MADGLSENLFQNCRRLMELRLENIGITVRELKIRNLWLYNTEFFEVLDQFRGFWKTHRKSRTPGNVLASIWIELRVL